MAKGEIIIGDCLKVLKTLPSQSVKTCITSPPYFGLRDYGHSDQIGMESTPDAFVARLVEVFREVRRVLTNDGTLWLNLGDSYSANGGAHGGRDDNQRGVGAKRTHDNGGGDQHLGRVPSGLKHKDLIGIPWRVAFALQADGWYLRSDIIWHKPNPMPESVTDRPTKAHEYLFLLSKSERYFYDAAAISEPAIHAGKTVMLGEKSFSKGQAKGAGLIPSGNATVDSVVVGNTRNRRSVWTVPTRPFRGAHFATFPTTLVEPCILAGSTSGDLVLDPFNGAGTTGLVSLRNGRNYIGIEINPEYAKIANDRLVDDLGFLASVKTTEAK